MKNTVLTNQQKAEYLYMPNQKVKFIYGESEYTGVVCGMGTSYNAIPILGTIWIVKIDNPPSTYCYECVTVPSVHMEPLEGM